MTDLSKIEARIVELCERARDELGWKFGPCTYQSDDSRCGCVLEACATMLGKNKSDWDDAADELGLDDQGVYFGAHFDGYTKGRRDSPCSAEDELAERLARRFVEGVG